MISAKPGCVQISEEERERFRSTIQGVGGAALASCEAELTRLQRHHKRFAATAVQVAKLRDAITKHWDQLGHSPDQRSPFTAMMTTPDSELSYKIFRAHEKALERLKRQAFGMRELMNYVSKREEILQARKDHGVPDERTRLRIERELPKYTAILLNRITKWEKESGLVFRWKGQPYLERMHLDNPNYDHRRTTNDEVHLESVLPAREEKKSPGDSVRNRHRVQYTNRHSIDERTPPRIPGMEEQLRRRRSDPQAPERPRWRNFIRCTILRRDHS